MPQAWWAETCSVSAPAIRIQSLPAFHDYIPEEYRETGLQLDITGPHVRAKLGGYPTRLRGEFELHGGCSI